MQNKEIEFRAFLDRSNGTRCSCEISRDWAWWRRKAAELLHLLLGHHMLGNEPPPHPPSPHEPPPLSPLQPSSIMGMNPHATAPNSLWGMASQGTIYSVLSLLGRVAVRALPCGSVWCVAAFDAFPVLRPHLSKQLQYLVTNSQAGGCKYRRCSAGFGDHTAVGHGLRKAWVGGDDRGLASAGLFRPAAFTWRSCPDGWHAWLVSSCYSAATCATRACPRAGGADACTSVRGSAKLHPRLRG